jgi:hypothetical protein
MWQQIIMALLVVSATGYVVWTFLSMTRRQRLLDALAGHGVLVQAAARHRARLATPGCSNCAGAQQHGKVKGR